MAQPAEQNAGDRIAKVLARAGLCSRRDAEKWIAEGRVAVNGKVITSPALNITARDRIAVDGEPLQARERTRLWLYHKPRGLVTTARDPEGRPTVFQKMPPDLPRVIAVGRLDINTEGLLLLTNDGGLARVLELPATGWLRRYRVRAHGEIDQPGLDTLQNGLTVDGVMYGAIEATLDRVQGSNVWITMALREGKNREIKRVLGHLGLSITRLIRVSFGPFQLGDLTEGEVREIRGRVLRDQLGEKLADAAGADFDAPVRQPPPPPAPEKPSPSSPTRRAPRTASQRQQRQGKETRARRRR
jgi:23S rRNA pseudouridine2605 synthase